MRKETRVPSDYGPVDVDLVLCDHIECSSVSQVQYAVGWLHVDAFGIEVQTMASYVPDTDYCSLNCLVADTKKYTE